MSTLRNPLLEPRQAPSIAVPKSRGEQLKRRLDAVGLRDPSLKIRLDGKELLLPLKPKTDLKTLREKMADPRLTIVKREFEVYPEKSRKNLATLLKDLGSTKTKPTTRAYDVIGDIAIIELPANPTNDSQRIGYALLTLHKRLRSVYARTGPVTGEYRLRELRYLAGEKKTETIHRENGCLFKVNLTSAFFNPRLGGERRRVADQVSPTERVLDMFAGVGPFSVLIARLSDAKVFAVDVNPGAVKCLRENIRLNHVEDRVEVFEIDATQLPPRLKGKMDRVIMNLPERSSEFVDAACGALKLQGGILHFYSFQSEPAPVKKAEELLVSRVEDSGRSVAKIQFAKSLREIAARTYQVVIDARVG